MAPIQINAAEMLARYIFSRNQYSSSNQTVKYTAFIPPPEKRLSVFRISDLTENEILTIGDSIGILRSKPCAGRADIKATAVVESDLSIDADDIPPRHANIVGWPEEDSAIKLKAMELAEKAQLHLK